MTKQWKVTTTNFAGEVHETTYTTRREAINNRHYGVKHMTNPNGIQVSIDHV